MPRLVDHDQRRAELAQAVWSLIREQGIAGVTMRNLSQKSGWSSGAIRHYLPNREAILQFAARQVNEQAERRLSTLQLTPDQRQNFLNLLLLLLPLDEQTQLWLEVWLSFVGAAVSESQFADRQGMLYRNLHQLFLSILQDFAAQGGLPHHTPDQAATELHALLDGLSIHLLLRVITPEQAKTSLTEAVERMLSR